MKNTRIILLLISLLTVGLYAAPLQPQVHEDGFLILLNSNVGTPVVSVRSNTISTGIASIDHLMAMHDVVGFERYLPSASHDDVWGDINLANIYRVKLGAQRADLESVFQEFMDENDILMVEMEPIERIEYVPSDPLFGDSWHMQTIMMEEAWDLWDIAGGDKPGNRNIVLASVDSGVQYTHPDLTSNVWVNQAEVPAAIFDAVDTDDDGYVDADEVLAFLTDHNGDGVVNLQDALHANSPFMNGIDDDYFGGGSLEHIDDLLGWDTAGTDGTDGHENDPMGFVPPGEINDPGVSEDHGTHVAGLLGATSDNGMGVASAIYNGSIMCVKVGINDGGLRNTMNGMLYAAKAGADIINASWGGGGYSAFNQATYNLIYETYEAITISSAGNGEGNFGTIATDVIGYPSGYDNVISVTGTGSTDNFYGNHYGETIDVVAPGRDIMSTVYTKWGGYEAWSGTSMASPLAGSVFGLVMATYPDKDIDWVINRIQDTCDPIDDINPDYAGGLGHGRINAYSAIASGIYPKLELNYLALTIDDVNGDGQVNPGESVDLGITLQNHPAWQSAAGVSATLATSVDLVTINDASVNYASIKPGDSGVAFLDNMSISLDADIPAQPITFELRVAANTSSEYPYADTLEFTLDVSMWQSNFPVAEMGPFVGGAAVLDFNYDGQQEILIAGEDSTLHAIQPDGTNARGFPIAFGAKFKATPAVADIDDDGLFDIVLPSRDKNLYVIDMMGNIDTIYTSGSALYGSTTLWDFDSDGDLEIVVPGVDELLSVIHHDGTAYTNFPLDLGGDMKGAAAIGDLLGDGTLQIVVGTKDEELFAIDLSGNTLAGFPVELDGDILSSPAIGNLDNSVDGSEEIVVGSDGDDFYAIDGSGTVLWEFDVPGGNVRTSPALADLDGDNDLEIIFGADDSLVYVLDHTGAEVTGWPFHTGGKITGSPVVGDINGDGSPEILIGSQDGLLYAFNADGTLSSGFPLYVANSIDATPALADIDGDGNIEVIVGYDQGLAVVDIPGSSTLTGSWSTDRGDLQRTGRVPGTPVGVEKGLQLPLKLMLAANYPNPFNPRTTISYSLPEVQNVKLEIVDLNGRVVNTLVQKKQIAGEHQAIWNSRDVNGKPVSSGLYFYRLSAGDEILVQKMTLLK